MNALMLGGRRYDLTTRTLVMGILEGGPAPTRDALLRRAEQLAADGADLIGVRAPPDPEGGGALDDLVRLVEALISRFDLPVSVATTQPRVLDAACLAGAACVHDPSGFSDPDWLPVAVGHRVAVTATEKHVGRALEAGIPARSIVLDADVDLEATPARGLHLRAEVSRLAPLGYPLLLSVPGPTGDDRRWSSLAAVAYAVGRGVRILRVHDVAGTVRVVRTLRALLDPTG